MSKALMICCLLLSTAAPLAEWLPDGDLFTPLTADPKEPRFYTAIQGWDDGFDRDTIGSVGLGTTYGLFRGEGWQLGLQGAVFSIFDLEVSTFDLLNSDFYFAVPLTFRRDAWSLRARALHRSAHVGDELLLALLPTGFEREEFSYEAIELIGSWEESDWRVYGGGTWIFNSAEPFERLQVQGGIERSGRPASWRKTRWIVAADVQLWEETDWNVDTNLKGGIEIGHEDGKRIGFLLEAYDGNVQQGQFYQLETSYVGFGIVFGL